MLIAVLAILGLVWGSFINAFVWRLHNKRSFVNDRSECPKCHHKLNVVDLIPVFSWVSLKGRCRYCSASISIQYPLVEISTSIIFVLSYMFWPTELDSFVPRLLFISWLIQVVLLIALFVYDLRWYLLPNKLTYTLILIAVIEQIISAEVWTTSLYEAGLGLIAGAGLFYLIFVLSKGRGIGGGDVKLGIYIGLALGWQKAVVALMSAFYSATIFSLPLLIAGKVNRKSKIPFGPFIIIGIMIAKLFGDSIFDFVAQITGIDYYI